MPFTSRAMSVVFYLLFAILYRTWDYAPYTYCRAIFSYIFLSSSMLLVSFLSTHISPCPMSISPISAFAHWCKPFEARFFRRSCLPFNRFAASSTKLHMDYFVCNMLYGSWKLLRALYYLLEKFALSSRNTKIIQNGKYILLVFRPVW